MVSFIMLILSTPSLSDSEEFIQFNTKVIDMENLIERADQYASEKTNELMAKAIAQAYADGYRDGYEDCEANGRIDETVDVSDMGLPSKTRWSLKYLEKEDGDTDYLPYGKAVKLGIPTIEQMEEIINCCKWKGSWSSTRQTFYGADCIGSTGNTIEFLTFGYMEGDERVGAPRYGGGRAYFWIQDDEEGDEKNAICIFDVEDGKPKFEIKKIFSGYKLPVILVRKKQLFRLHEGLAVVGVGLEDLHERQEFVGCKLFYQLASVGVEVDTSVLFSPHGVEPEAVGGFHQFVE